MVIGVHGLVGLYVLWLVGDLIKKERGYVTTQELRMAGMIAQQKFSVIVKHDVVMSLPVQFAKILTQSFTGKSVVWIAIS